MEQVTFPMRVLGMLGCRKLIVTNAAGGIRKDIPEGSLVAIIGPHLTGMNAAMGPNEPRFACVEGAGQRFFDMSTAYSPALRKLAMAEAEKQRFRWAKACILRCWGRALRRPRRYARSGRWARTWWGCRRCTR